LFSSSAAKEEHHVLADVDHATASNKIACYYDPLIGQVLGPPPEKYEMTHLIYTPLGPNGTVKLSKLPTVSSFHARFTNRLNRAIASRSSKSAQEQLPKQQPRSPTKVKKTEPHTPSCRSPGTRKATALSALDFLRTQSDKVGLLLQE
jgi:hypothetical protein